LAQGDFGLIREPLAYYHQRRESPDPVYGNSILAGTADHQRYDVLLRNNLIRLALRDNPALIGVLQPVLRAVHEQTEALNDFRNGLYDRAKIIEERVEVRARIVDERIDVVGERINALCSRLDRIEEHLGEVRVVALWQRKMLLPIQHVWVSLGPVRRMVGRLFGRARP
jgi:hypothetical protein